MRARSHGATSLTWIWCMTSATTLLVLHVKHCVRDNEYLRGIAHVWPLHVSLPRDFPLLLELLHVFLNLKIFCMSYTWEGFCFYLTLWAVRLLQPFFSDIRHTLTTTFRFLHLYTMDSHAVAAVSEQVTYRNICLPQGRRTNHTWQLHHLVHGDHYGWIQSFGITYFQDQGSSLWDWLHSRWSTWRPLRQGQPISGKDYMCQLHALHGYWRHSSCLYKVYPTWNLSSK